MADEEASKAVESGPESQEKDAEVGEFTILQGEAPGLVIKCSGKADLKPPPKTQLDLNIEHYRKVYESGGPTFPQTGANGPVGPYLHVPNFGFQCLNTGLYGPGPLAHFAGTDNSVAGNTNNWNFRWTDQCIQSLLI